jgi:uncharacterized membrane protein HdeD (DUF308 family)
MNLDYASRPRAVSPRSWNRWGWLGVFGGTLGGVLGFLFAIYLDHQPALEVHWAATALAALLMLGGAAVCIAGIVFVAIAASRPG